MSRAGGGVRKTVFRGLFGCSRRDGGTARKRGPHAAILWLSLAQVWVLHKASGPQALTRGRGVTDDVWG